MADAFDTRFWPLSVAATALAWCGYAPEFWRLWRQRRSSGTGLCMWFIWIASSGLSTAYAVVSGAQPLIVVNVGFVCLLTLLAAAGNCYFPRADAPPPAQAPPGAAPYGDTSP